MLILAGVTLSVTVGENGVLTQATTAVKKNKKAKVLEDVKLAWTGIKADYYAKWAQNSGVQFSQIVNKIILQKYLEGTVNSLEKTGEREYTLDYTENDKEESRYIILLDEEGNAEFSEELSIPETLALEITNGEEITKESKTIKATLMNLEEPVNWSIKEGAEKISLSSTKGEEITVTAEAGGEATIQARCGNHTKTCTVTVNVVTPIRSIDSISGEPTINLNDEFPQTILTANVTPVGATETSLIWESLNEDIAIVTNVDGRSATITGNSVGTAKIKVSKRGEEETVFKIIDIEVIQPIPVTGIKLRETGTETDLNLNNTITMASSGNGTTVTKSFTAILEPENTTNTGVVWDIVDSSATGIISIGTPVLNENKSTVLVTAGENPGSATLRVTSEDGSYTAECIINVKRSVLVTVQTESTSKGTIKKPLTASSNYFEGTEIDIEASAKTGYKFSGWFITKNNGTEEQTAVSSNASYSYKIPEDDSTTSILLKAKFVEKPALKEGSYIKIGDEGFYVIKKSGNNLTLLAKYNLTVTPNETTGKYEQINADISVTGCGMANEWYWKSALNKDNNVSINLNTYTPIPNTETDSNNAILRARKYASDLGVGATGRLLTYEEALVIYQSGTSQMKLILYGAYGTSISSGGHLFSPYGFNYFLSTAKYTSSNGGKYYLYGIRGNSQYPGFSYPHENRDTPSGVRPVIEVNESSVY